MFKKSNLKIGLDLGSAYIKAVKIEHSNNHHLIKDFAIAKIHSSNAISSLTKDILNRIKAQNISLNISLSGQNIVCRYVNLPLLEEEEFKNALKFEIVKYVPFSIDDIFFDGCILRKDLQQNKMLVVMVAVKKEYLLQRINLIKDINYEVNLVGVDSLALVDCFNFNLSKRSNLPTNKSIAILNIGNSFSNLNILEGNIPVLSRDIRIAGSEITSRISTDLVCDLETAERIKLQAGLDEEQLQKIKPSLENVLSLLAQELRISFDYYESQGIASVEKLYLCGGQLLIKIIADILSHYLGIEISLFDPLEEFEFYNDLNIEEIKKYSLQMAVVLGLALR
ncbi:MAG: pilus assembly protein PilM [Candidatus Omnitrophica bacterium]|nr:pilus assembly protein PilM [Candidatus Omnitrophota bacterium]